MYVCMYIINENEYSQISTFNFAHIGEDANSKTSHVAVLSLLYGLNVFQSQKISHENTIVSISCTFIFKENISTKKIVKNNLLENNCYSCAS